MPGHDWTYQDLDHYKISISFQDAATFFDTPVLPPLSNAIHEEVLIATKAEDAVDDTVYNLLAQLDLAMSPPELDGADSAVLDFVVALFHVIGYARRPRVVRTHMELQFVISHEETYTSPDACIIDRDTEADAIVLLVQECKRSNPGDPFAQLVAGAIAAFGYHNKEMVRRTQRPLESMVIPGIVISGSLPTFVKIPVTSELVRCSQYGENTVTPTVVLGYIPELPRPDNASIEGMMPLDNRRIVLQCYEAFKRFFFNLSYEPSQTTGFTVTCIPAGI